MELHIVLDGGRDLAGQVYRQLSEAIRAGRLADGQQVPPSRLLAQQLGLSRKTVAQAYARLTLERLLVGRVGVGSFVCAPAAARPRVQAAAQLASAAVLRKWEAMATPLRRAAPQLRSRFDFLGGSTTPSHFPQDAWRRCVLHALRQDAQVRGRYAATEGLPALREAIARHTAFSRGLVCTAAQVLVTNGTQQALDLLGRLLLEPGCSVAVEEPGYPMARALFASHGARVLGVPVDAEGIVAASIPDGVSLIYVTPTHQFPLGMPMSVARRHALLARARAIGAIVVEDDYDSAFRYEGRPADSLQSLDTHGIVAFVGSFSKVLLPELRLGYAVLPQPLLPAALTVKHLSDWHCATMPQHALAKFIDDGYLLKHIRRCHALYAARRERLLQWFAGPLAPWFRLVPASAGFHVAALCVVPLDVALLIRLARRADVGLYPLAQFYADSPPQQGLLFGYGAIDVLDIDVALARVRDILLAMA
ncbi:PLP-dependent aminotransferase family protein [Janthinobacterium fluminis]|uniref:PLP-dependent aminotransferase family protein n=1 Tax=Janthinobacterium fluminis TaxID=2987524 RepID=A0ABT5JUE9_9BURK|nr:PLP-dependent aminotransferase family protein [Janthinobacterium fluminis]MDC8756347.1 PLP-dependent aminotransferase family protein [Janthinobacterium fluminis]